MVQLQTGDNQLAECLIELGLPLAALEQGNIAYNADNGLGNPCAGFQTVMYHIRMASKSQEEQSPLVPTAHLQLPCSVVCLCRRAQA
ncbi:hypothetical protein WJX77_000520 [Trebouxia sp. C0004]